MELAFREKSRRVSGVTRLTHALLAVEEAKESERIGRSQKGKTGMTLLLLLAGMLLCLMFLIAGLAKLADRNNAPRGRLGALLYGSTSEGAGRADGHCRGRIDRLPWSCPVLASQTRGRRGGRSTRCSRRPSRSRRCWAARLARAPGHAKT
jgi:hypothetical protein